MSNDLTLARGTSSFTAGAAKFGADGLASGVYYSPNGAFPVISTSGPFTVETWVKTTASGAVRVALGDETAAWWLGIDGSGQLACMAITSTTVISDGAWHHIAVVVTSGAASLYCDGARVASGGTWTTLGNSVAAVGGYGTNTSFDWSGSIDEVRISNVARYTGTTYTTPVAAFSSDGNTLGLYHLDGNATDSAAVATTTTIAPDDPNIVYSPYTWLVGPPAKTINAGAYLRCLIAGSPTSLTATFDVSNMASPASQIAYRVDGSAWTQVAVSASVALTIPAAVTAWSRHLVEIVVKSTTQGANRWNAPQNTAVILTGITCGNLGCTTVPIQRKALNVAVIGDSITEGVLDVNSTATNDTDRSDAQLGWAYHLIDTLGAEVGVIGFGGTGVDTAGSGNVPAATTSYALLWAGQSRAWTPAPDLIVVNLGQNGGSQAGYTTLLNGLLAATPTTTLIAALRPFTGAQAANIQAAVAGCSAPARVKYIDTTGWWDSSDSSDSVHPYGDQNITKLAPYVAAAGRTLLKRGAMYLLGSTSATDKLITPTRL